MPSIEQLSDHIGVFIKDIDLSNPLGDSDFNFIEVKHNNKNNNLYFY